MLHAISNIKNVPFLVIPFKNVCGGNQQTHVRTYIHRITDAGRLHTHKHNMHWILWKFYSYSQHLCNVYVVLTVLCVTQIYHWKVNRVDFVKFLLSHNFTQLLVLNSCSSNNFHLFALLYVKLLKIMKKKVENKC